MSFGIQYGEVFLDVAENDKLTVEWVSSYFNDDKVFAGSYSYPINLPLTEKNKSVLGNGHLLENRQARKKISVNIILFDQSWKRADLIYDISSQGFEGSLQIDVAVVAEWMRERSLASAFTVTNNGKFVSFIELAGRGSESGNKQMVKDTQTAAPGEYPYVYFPLRNDMATGEMIADENAKFEDWLINPHVNGVNTFSNTLWTPYFYLQWVIKEVCKFLGFTATGSFLSDPEVAKWVIYNNGVIWCDDFKKSNFSVCPAKHLPDISISDLMKLLRNDFFVRIYFDSNDRVAYFIKADDLLQTDDILDLSGSLIKDSLKIKYNNVQGYEVLTKIDDGDEMNQIFPYVKSYTIGNSDTPKSHELKSAITYMFSGSLISMYKGRVPWVRQSVNLYSEIWVDKSSYNPANTYGKNSFGFRLLAYQGIQRKNAEGALAPSNTYPYGTSDHRDPNGLETYDYSVSPGSESGYLNRFASDWFNMLCETEQIDFMALISLKKFMDITPLKKVVISTESLAKTSLFLDRITFEPSEKNSKINTRILAYPQYNIMAISELSNIKFEEGEIIVPELKVYAKLTVEGEYYYINKSNEKEKRAYIYVSFYRDIAGTIPYSVTNMNVRYQAHETSPKGTDVVRIRGPFKVTGTKVRLGEEMTWRYVKSTLWNGWTGTNRSVEMRLLEVDNSYTVIS
ncbi:hypothetical protein ACR777_15055 [Sphingobacterium spiritivorum]|uniref:hypothetical protein n=1 Tax=Sphingobacterium spiritivorum TaxID=258 RepID=UPI003DA54629